MAGVSWGSYSKWLLGEHETISLEVCPLASGEKPLGLANFCEIRWKVDFSFSRCSNFKLFTRPILFVWWGLAMFPNIFVCGTWPFEPWRRFFLNVISPPRQLSLDIFHTRSCEIEIKIHTPLSPSPRGLLWSKKHPVDSLKHGKMQHDLTRVCLVFRLPIVIPNNCSDHYTYEV